MRQSIIPAIAAMLILTITAPLALADPRGEAEAARAQLSFAQSRLERALREAEDAHAAYDDLARRHAAAIAALQHVAQDRNATVDQITAAESSLPDIASAMEAAERAAEGYARSIPEAEQRANETAEALEAIRAEATQAFEQSPQWANLLQALEQAQARHEQAAAGRLEALVRDDLYLRRLMRAQEAQAAMEAERETRPLDQARLTALSNAWMEAVYAVSQMESAALAEDPEVGAALAAVRDAQSAMQQARRDFEMRLNDDPRLRDAAVAHASAREALDIALSGARAAEAEATRLRHELQRLEHQAITSRQHLQRLDQDLRQYEFAVQQAGRDLQDVSLDVSRARQEVEQAARERDYIAGRLRREIEDATEAHARHEAQRQREQRAREHAERSHDRDREEAERRRAQAIAERGRDRDDDARQASSRDDERARHEAEQRRQREKERQRREQEQARRDAEQEQARRKAEAERSAQRREQADRDRQQRADEARREQQRKKEETKREEPKREQRREDSSSDRGQRYQRR